MKPIKIELPIGDNIECWSFIRSIVKATHPTLEDSKGIDCVIGKMVSTSTAGNNIPLSLPFALTDDDRAKFTPLLVHLPELNGKMFDLEIDEFLYLYSALPNRLDWEPIIRRKIDIDKIKEEQWKFQTIHRIKLQERLMRGKIQAFDANNFSESHIKPNVYISKEHATNYLRECGLVPAQNSQAFEKNEITALLTHEKNTIPTELTLIIADTETDTSYNNKVSATPVSTSKSISHKDTQQQWTTDELTKLSAFQEALKKNRIRNYTELTAKEYGITPTRVRYLLAKRKKNIKNTHGLSGLEKTLLNRPAARK